MSYYSHEEMVSVYAANIKCENEPPESVTVSGQSLVTGIHTVWCLRRLLEMLTVYGNYLYCHSKLNSFC